VEDPLEDAECALEEGQGWASRMPRAYKCLQVLQ